MEWYGATAAALMLGYSNPHKAVLDHCKKDGVTIREVIENSGFGPRTIKKKFINEGNLYRLIVKAADQSINPEIKERAEKFEKWIFDEVIPQIRKTGQYDVRNSKQQEIIKRILDLTQQVEEYEAQLVKAEANTAEYRKAYRNWLAYRNKLKQLIKMTRETIQLRTKELALIEGK